MEERGEEVDIMFGSRTLDRLDRMLEDAINGEFTESSYDESKLSRLESKWKQYLSTSCLVKENLEREKASIKSFVSDISHQTKTPMTNIKMYAQLLEENLETGSVENNQKLIQEIVRQTERLDFLIQSLTKLSRLETNVVEVKPVEQSVLPLIEESVEGILAKAERKDIRIYYEADKEQKACYDLKWTKEALGNILDNAVKYSPTGSEVRVGITDYELYTDIWVKDQGIGITEEEIPKIFGRFYRSEEVQQEDGVGIGLFLAREIVSKQEGYIKAESKPGEGTVFHIFVRNKM